MELHRYLLPLVVFVSVGPGIGLLTALLFGAPSGPLNGLGIGLILIYMFAWIPALISGCLYVLLWPLFRRLRKLGTHGIGCVTGLATVLPLLVFVAIAPNPSKRILFALVFAIPAALCGVLAANFRVDERRA